MKKPLFIILTVVILGGLIAYKLSSNKKAIDAKNQPTDKSKVVIPVTVANAESGTVSNKMVKTGSLNPFDEANIISASQGKLTSVNFDLGTHLGKGAVAARVDVDLKRLSLDDAQQKVKKLENDYQTYKELLAGNGTTQSKLDEIKLSLDNARNQVDQINNQLKDFNILSPIGGIIVQKNAVRGEFVSPGTVLGKLVDISRLKVQVMVGETDVYQLKIGQTVKITTDIYPNQVFPGKITFISPQGDATHNYPVEITIVNSGKSPLKAGTFVYADFSKQTTETVLQIPREALVESVKNPYVYTIENGAAKIRKIQVGRTIGENIEVTGGLQQGEQVIVTGQINLNEGTKVEVVK